jgi:hypothetical protein
MQGTGSKAGPSSFHLPRRSKNSFREKSNRSIGERQLVGLGLDRVQMTTPSTSSYPDDEGTMKRGRNPTTECTSDGPFPLRDA